jgi:predicted ester cyclase
MDAAQLRAHREAIVRRHMEGENVLDFDAVIDTFAHPRYAIIATGAVYDGEAEVRDYFRTSRTAFPDQRNELIAMHHADDSVIVEFYLLGTHKGPLAGIEPTGRPFKCQMTAIYLFDGRGLVCERVYFDTATILRQLTA